MANTTTLTLEVTEQKLELVTNEVIASGGLNDVILHFSFLDNTWDTLNLKAVFRSNQDKTAYMVSVDSGTKNVTVPAEVMREKGVIYVGLAGSIVNGQGVATLVRTSVVIGLRLELGTPSEYTESEEDTRYWVTVAEMWATGGTGGTPSATNNAKYFSELAEDYKDDAQSYAEDAEQSAENAQTYAESINPENFVRKDSSEQSFEGTVADMVFGQADSDNAKDILGKLPNEPDEAHTMSVATTIPTSMGASGSVGQVVFDTTNGYAYMCVASNSWKRISLSNF